jgi:lipid-binding SYLF domain-containing protein
MKRNSHWFAGHFVCRSVMLLAFASLSWGTESEQQEIGKRLDAAATILGEIMTTPDKAIPGPVLREAKCIVVVPGMINVALGIGARRGKGVATCRTTSDWSAPAPVGFREGSVGFQVGGQSVDLIMLVMNREAANRLLSSTLKIGGDVSGTAGTNSKPNAISISKGLHRMTMTPPCHSTRFGHSRIVSSSSKSTADGMYRRREDYVKPMNAT